MFKRLSQQLLRGKQKTRRLSEMEIYISPLLKRFRRPFGKNQKKAEEFQQGEFSGEAVEEESTPLVASNGSLHSRLRTAVSNLEEIADIVKVRARQEVEAEAARIIAQAQLEAQEIKDRAKIDAQKRAEDTISAANRKAEATEAEGKHKVLQFLIGAAEEAEKEITEEYERAYSRLSYSLQSLVNEAHNIESELKSKRLQLWESKTFELKQYEAGLLGAYQAAVGPSEASSPGKIGAEPEVVSQEKVEEPAQPQEEPLAEKVEGPTQLQEETVVAEPVGEAVEELVEQRLPTGKPAREVESAPLVLDSRASYVGEMELEIATPVDPKMAYKLYDHLQTIPELKVLHTRGSWDQGTVIAVALEKPLPLVSLLSEMVGVEVTQVLAEKERLADGVSSSLLGTKRKGTTRIKLTLKEPARG